MIRHTLLLYRSRFGWEIAVFWLISLVNTALISRPNPPAWLGAGAVVEIVALAWLTIRLVLAEDGFRTSGGWWARPFPRKVRHYLPLATATVVIWAPAIVRAFAFQRIFGRGDVWTDVNSGSWLAQLVGWLLFIALPLKLFGLLVLHGVEGRARSAAWATLALILLPLLAVAGTKFGKRPPYFSQSGDDDPADLAQGIQHELPDARQFLGTWNDPPRGLVLPAARLVAKFPLDPGTPLAASQVGLHGARVTVQMRTLMDDRGLAGKLGHAVAVLRYADGTVGSCAVRRTVTPGPPLPFFPADEWVFSGDFFSPLALPEFEGDPADLTRGLELLFFLPDFDRPMMRPDPVRETPSDLENFEFHPATMTELFTQFPWSDKMWRSTAEPFLVARATREDIPFLLERLQEDPRLAGLFIRKGWATEALPVLRQLLARRIPMPTATIALLAAEKDPELGGDLAAVALQVKSGLADLEMPLREQPGFDWPAFVRELWRRRKYTTNWVEPASSGEFWIAALWAAREGDESAFLKIAELAAQGRKWEQDQLPSLVAGGDGDLTGFIRSNFGRLNFDPALRKWRADR